MVEGKTLYATNKNIVCNRLLHTMFFVLPNTACDRAPIKAGGTNL